VIAPSKFFLALRTGFNVLTGDMDEATVTAERLRAKFAELPTAITPATGSLIALAAAGALTGRDFSGVAQQVLAANEQIAIVGPTAAAAAPLVEQLAGTMALQAEGAKAAAEQTKLFNIEVLDLKPGFDAATESATALQIAIAQASPQFGLIGEGAKKAADELEKARAAAREAAFAFSEIGANASASGAEITRAFGVAVKAALSPKDVQALQIEFNKLAQDSRISFQQLDQAAKLAGDQLEKLKTGTKDLSLELKDAFKELGVKSREALQIDAEKAQKSFDLIVAAVKRGEISVDNLKEAFIALAKKQLAVVENASAQEKAQVEGMIRAKAAALGLTDALDEIGIAGQKAGAEVASGAAQAASALGQVASAASGAAGSIGDLGAASSEASSGLREVGSSATATSGELTQFSSATQGAVKSQLGAITAYERGLEVQRLQQESFDREKRQLGALTDGYDPLKQQLDDLARKYPNVSEAARRSLAEQRAGIEGLGKTIADVQAQVTQNTSSVGSPTGLQGNGLTNQGPGQIAPPSVVVLPMVLTQVGCDAPEVPATETRNT